MKIPFTKMHGLGNDFVVINNLNRAFSLTAEQIRQMADRHTGIGFDQLLLIESPTITEVDFHYRIFNADGGEVAQCGNGARCFARYVYERGLTTKKTLHVSTLAGSLTLYLEENQDVRVNMGIPKTQVPYSFSFQQKICGAGFVSLGNPHLILEVADVSQAPVQEWGAALNQHTEFPEGINVGFMQVIDKHHIQIRVYERGVGETLACGSGACAAAIVGCLRGVVSSPAKVKVLQGTLQVLWEGEGQPVWLIGPATFVYDGHYESG